MSDDAGTDALARTPLFVEHRSLGATLVPFAGYAMPVRYPAGIMAEHNPHADRRRPLRRLAHGPAAAHRRRRRPDA